MKNARIKKSLTCKTVESFEWNTSLVKTHTPKAGDVGIFRILDAKGGYIMDEFGRANNLFDDDLVMLTFGHRYATNQVEGYVPSQPVKQCQLLGRGGVAGLVKSKNALFKNTPSELELVAYATDIYGNVINTVQIERLIPFTGEMPETRVILSVGASMDSGKTTTAAWLCGGLKKKGYQVAYLKLTGTTFPKDAELALSRGADYASDFSQYGFPSTYLLSHRTLLNLYQTLLRDACMAAEPDFVVIEIADGLFQRETSMLLKDKKFLNTIDNIIFSCGDSLSALAGTDWLKQNALTPFAVSGLITASPLLVNEVECFSSIPVLTLSDLLEGKAVALLEDSRSKQRSIKTALQKAA